MSGQVCQCLHVYVEHMTVCVFLFRHCLQREILRGGRALEKNCKSMFLFWFCSFVYYKMQKKLHVLTETLTSVYGESHFLLHPPTPLIYDLLSVFCVLRCVCARAFFCMHGSLFHMLRRHLWCRRGGLWVWARARAAGQWMCRCSPCAAPRPPPPPRLYKDPGALSICLKKQVWRNLSKNKTTV